MDGTRKLSKHHYFEPTPAMKLYAFHRSKMGQKARDSTLSKRIGIRRETASRWKKVNGFISWLEEQIASYRAPIHDLLESTALDKIVAGDFKYWEAMGKKHGFIAEQYNPPKNLEIYIEPTVDGLLND